MTDTLMLLRKKKEVLSCVNVTVSTNNKSFLDHQYLLLLLVVFLATKFQSTSNTEELCFYVLI